MMIWNTGGKLPAAMIESLRAIIEKPSRLAIGLMSGTSVDGIDAVVVRITGFGPTTRIETLAEKTYPYRSEIRSKIFKVFTGGAVDVCQMNFVLGELFGNAARQIADQASIPLGRIDFIASQDRKSVV